MQQYPDSVVVEIYDKTSDGSAITNAFQALGVQNPLQVGTIGIFHLNLRGKIDISPKTGKEYAMNYAADLWKVEPYNAQPAAQPFSAQGTQAAPVQQLQQPPQQQFNPAASAFAPQPPFQGQQPQPQFGGQAYQQVPY
ncbi:MAG: hypothetical protein MJZ30_06045 [Paludibacteraceae bacterium]|nr:hypothetical protein [Paludibacteraceae bacterium]